MINVCDVAIHVIEYSNSNTSQPFVVLMDLYYHNVVCVISGIIMNLMSIVNVYMFNDVLEIQTKTNKLYTKEISTLLPKYSKTRF